jgi:hypothetical protein
MTVTVNGVNTNTYIIEGTRLISEVQETEVGDDYTDSKINSLKPTDKY